MTPEKLRIAAQAKQILENDVFNDVIDAVEADATVRCLYAAPEDHDGRQAAAAEARVARELRARLTELVEQAEKPERVSAGAPA